MPSADHLNFDNFDEPPPATIPAPTAADDTEDPWGFTASSPPKSSARKKKKGKKNAPKIPPPVEDGNDSPAHPQSITPPPPTDHGAKLGRPPPHAEPEPEPEPVPITKPQQTPESAPLVSVEEDDDDDAVPAEYLEPEPPAKPTAKLSPAPSAAVKSPRLAMAKPASTSSPPSWPVSLYGNVRDRAPPRRESFVTHPSPRPRLVDPPPPHMPQAHFFGLPDLGFGFGQKQETGRPAGSDGYCCRLDTLADAGDAVSASKARDALLVGCQGGLEVFRILPNKLEVVGRLEGLRGAVIDAKLLPHTEKYDYIPELRPLVAVVTHGPMLEDRRDSGPEGEGTDLIGNEPPSHYQTTVDVYSLQAQLFIATLYASTPVPLDQPTLGQVSLLPDPVGDLEVNAAGRFITVSSGKSGEVFVYSDTPNRSMLHEPQFRCLGKFWTTIQKPLSTRAATQGTDPANPAETKAEPQKPLHSLSQRWLAIVPPYTSSISAQGAPLITDVNPSPPGVGTHAAPPQPVVTCEVVGMDTEGTWSKLGRQAAQGLVKYSQKGFEMGWQGWKELTQPSPPGAKQVAEPKEDLFPPTKAPSDDPTRLTKEPALVSIIDLEALLVWEEHKPKYLPAPMATFALVDGCNFLSLSAIGTKMMTASRKGEASTIWDLSQIAHGVPRRAGMSDEDSSTSPCIKQLQRIARNSPSTVLDCSWSADDDAVAILTAHGTVHLHEVASRPARRKRKSAGTGSTPAAEKADATVSLSTGLSPPSSNQGFLGSIKSWSQTVSTQVNTIRSTNPASAFGLPTTFAGFREATAAAGNAGSRAVARGLSQGLTAAKGGAADYWHADDNKIRHTKALQEPFSAKSLTWIKRNNTTSVAITCGGVVHVHPVARVTRRKGDAIVSGLKHERSARKQFPLPPIATRAESGRVHGAKADSCAGQGPHGFWSLRRSLQEAHDQRHTTNDPLAISSDVETNPPYCPFHVDVRVGIYVFDEVNHSQCEFPKAFELFQLQGHGMDEKPWLFGEPLPPSSKVNEHMPDEFHDSTVHLGEEHSPEHDDDDENVGDIMESRLTIQPSRSGKKADEQIRVNTRRRKGRISTNAEVDLLEDDESFV